MHARGSAAHGFFQPYKSHRSLTRASFLADPKKKTPVFVRFSTVAGGAGSADTVRDVRGFAVKFYTDEGNFDLVGNNIPVFFIQDAMKFPDLVHAVKTEPHHDMPQAASAHDTFWDFVSLMPESTHMLMWAMSDRAIPRSYRMMEGFGVHTFKLVNADGEVRLVKFHWKPKLGTHALLWDEAQELCGRDADFHRRDLWESIEAGAFPEFELGVQVMTEDEALALPFDVLDATKLVPEEMVPVTPLGRLVLDRNPDNFFAETEQVAFHPGHVVPGIDFTNDPLLQGRLFSYTDTQLIRLGGPNFHQIPVNRPQLSVPQPAARRAHAAVGAEGPRRLRARFARRRRARTGARRLHDGDGSHRRQDARAAGAVRRPLLAGDALLGEPGRRREDPHRRRVRVRAGQGRDAGGAPAHGRHAGERRRRPRRAGGIEARPRAGHAAGRRAATSRRRSSARLRCRCTTPTIRRPRARSPSSSPTASTAPGAAALKTAIEAAGGVAKIVAPAAGDVKPARGKGIAVDHRLATVASVLFDALAIPGGAASIEKLAATPGVAPFLTGFHRHLKPVWLAPEATDLYEEVQLPVEGMPGIAVGGGAKAIDAFARSLARRFHDRELPAALRT